MPTTVAGGLSYLHNVSDIPLVYRTIGQQLGITAEKYGSQEALVSLHETKRFTFSEIIDKVSLKKNVT